MTNELELVRELIDVEHHFWCEVRHEDAGGKCGRSATLEVYGLCFCEAHGEEAKLMALEGLYYDAANFLERLDNPGVPEFNREALSVVREGVSTLRAKEGEAFASYEAALVAAYPNPSEALRERVHHWQLDEGDHLPVHDLLLFSLGTLHKCMRTAFEAHQTWLVEKLEYEREALAAQAAVALNSSSPINS